MIERMSLPLRNAKPSRVMSSAIRAKTDFTSWPACVSVDGDEIESWRKQLSRSVQQEAHRSDY
jgi:hypothetical protein